VGLLCKHHVEEQQVRIEVLEAEDVLHRIATLNSTLMRVLRGNRLLCHVGSDYAEGWIEFRMLAEQRVEPVPAPSAVEIRITPVAH
jgi:hypothetical protein